MDKVWKVALANYVNEQDVDVIVDGEILDKTATSGSYMNDSMGMMFTKEGIREAFDCSINLYDDTLLSIEKGESSVELYLNSNEMVADEKAVALDYPAIRRDEKIYVPAEVVEKGFGYSYEWNSTELSATFTRGENTTDLPAYYNLAEKEKISDTKNQESLGACWAFAALGAIESSLMPEVVEDYSVDHMLYNSGFGLNPEEGGDYIMSIAYLASWKGPVAEEDDPYGDGVSNSELEAIRHVQEVKMIDRKDYASIKKMIYKYGAVESSMYMGLIDASTIDDRYYNAYNASYCYPGESNPNHEIIIIGWDDNYPKENFNQHVFNDGAFICQNSWGTHFGENGIFYVSYEDGVIGTCSEAYTKIEDTENYDNIYQYDSCGWIGRVGFNKNHACFSNVYQAEGNEILKAVSFYATGKDSSYAVYVDTDYTGNGEIHLSGEPLAKGKVKYSGYYTIDLDADIDLKLGQKFAVIVEIDTPGSSHPIAMEMNADDMRTETVVLEGKESYISNDGKTWENTQENSGCNVCLKAFTVGR
ncbi:MAG: lectin like domain-containing protein [Lachnospiraceae bacterium]|nr:lectin like domain-containing protein [Lachnospiraceae bacterium]